MFVTQLFQTRNFAAWLAAGLLVLSAAAWAAAQAFDFTVFGNFKRMRHTGDTKGQVRLAELPQAAGNWGVGALAGLKGEVLLYNGRLLVSRGDEAMGRTSGPQPSDEAALFASTKVRAWVDVPVPSDMNQTQFQAFLLEQAQSHGLDGARPFPFLVQGRYPALTWHVVSGQMASASPHSGSTGGSAGKHAERHVFDQPDTAGTLVGLYSAAQFEGVVSHPGERFHIHFADHALNASGHVDAYSVARASVLKLPLH